MSIPNKKNICLIFTGLERTILLNHTNLKENLINEKDSYDIYFVTWKNESTEDFLSCFPNSKIIRISELDVTDSEFQNWQKGLNIHSSWLGKYKTNENALFRYYQQIYIWKEATKILETKKYDIVIRCRTDIRADGALKEYFDELDKLPNTILFPREPKQSIFNSDESCPDYIMIGTQDTMYKALRIVDYLHKYKRPCNGILDVVQPESTMYLFLKGEGIDIHFLPYNITIIR